MRRIFRLLKLNVTMAIGRGIYKYLAAEHVLIAYMMASGLSIPTKTQYVEQRIAKALGATTYNQSACLTNRTSPEYNVQIEIQRQSTMWMLYLTVSLQFPALIMSNIWGAFSDRYGRHVACILPCIGLTLNYVISALVVVFELPLATLLGGSVILGLSGDLTTLVVGCAGYISDVTLPESKERAARFVMIDVSFTLSTSIIQFAIGYVIKLYGFAAPFYLGIILISICACFIICCLPDRRRLYATENQNNTTIQTKTRETSPLNILKNIYQLFQTPPGSPTKRAWRLCAYNFIICAYIMLVVANSVISVLYTTGQPFCMNPVQEGHYGASMFAIYAAGTLLAGFILQKFVSSFWILHLTSISVIASTVLLALAKTSLFLYIALGVGMFTFMVMPLTRNNMANLVGPDEQGVLFAFSGGLTSVAGFTAPLVFNAVYSSTLHFMPGFVYMVMAGIGAAVWLVIMILHIKEPRPNLQYQPLDVDEPHEYPSSSAEDLDGYHIADGDGWSHQVVPLAL